MGILSAGGIRPANQLRGATMAQTTTLDRAYYAGHDDLEDRVDRLERAVAQMQDADVMRRLCEERVADYLKREQEKGALVATDTDGAVRPEPIQVEVRDAPGTQRPWLVIDFLRDLRDFLLLHWDSRYRMTRTTQLLTPAVIGLLALVWVFFDFYIIGPALRMVIVLFWFKGLTRETQRYRAVIASLPKRYRDDA